MTDLIFPFSVFQLSSDIYGSSGLKWDSMAEAVKKGMEQITPII